MPDEPKQVDILQGTLNMMILQALQQGPANGYEIAKFSRFYGAVDRGP
jgi:DNA-binding PadR family transcriptional regulator